MTGLAIFKRTVMGACAVAAMLSVTLPEQARAADIFTDMVSGPHDWRGLYVGGQVGYMWGDLRENFPTIPVANTHDDDVDGFLGGVHVGYNLQAADAVFGVVADVNFGDVDSRYTSDNGRTLRTEMDWNGSVRGRVGVLVTDRTLLYATGGLAFAELEHTHTLGIVNSRFKKTHLGFTVGGGVEHAFTDLITVFVEGRYTVLADESFGPGNGLIVPHSFGMDYWQAQAGISLNVGNWFAP